jgi:hypothetical protein
VIGDDFEEGRERFGVKEMGRGEGGLAQFGGGEEFAQRGPRLVESVR